MGYDYSAVMSAAIYLEQFSGYLDTDDLKRQREAQDRFNTARHHFVFSALASGEDPEQITSTIVNDLDEMVQADPYSAATYAFVRDELVARVESEAKKSPLQRKIVRWAPTAALVALVIAYFAVRLLSGVTVDQPIQTQAGIEQRAAALIKAARYDDWASSSSRRVGFIKGVLLWPIKPTDAEVKAAVEFIEITGESLGYLYAQKHICGGPIPGSDERLSEDEIALVRRVADYVVDEKTRWREPPELTLLEPIKAAYPCGASSAIEAAKKFAR